MFLFSILFLLMTLAAYAAEKSLREHLHGKMTVVFLGNLTICFIVVALSWFQVNCPKEWNVLYSTWFVHMIFPRLLKLTVAAVFYQATSSRSCFWKQKYSYVNPILVLEAKIFIYSYLFLLQYFFLAFFFCLNAIAINTYLPFSMISATFQKVQQNQNIYKVSWGPCE